jgi:prevent-host-death family protein
MGLEKIQLEFRKEKLDFEPTVTVAQAKNHLPVLIHRAETNGMISITRRGKIVAYIISEENLKRLTRKENGFYKKINSFREEAGKESLLEKDEFKNLRDKTQGRKISI